MTEDRFARRRDFRRRPWRTIGGELSKAVKSGLPDVVDEILSTLPVPAPPERLSTDPLTDPVDIANGDRRRLLLSQAIKVCQTVFTQPSVRGLQLAVATGRSDLINARGEFIGAEILGFTDRDRPIERIVRAARALYQSLGSAAIEATLPVLQIQSEADRNLYLEIAVLGQALTAERDSLAIQLSPIAREEARRADNLPLTRDQLSQFPEGAVFVALVVDSLFSPLTALQTRLLDMTWRKLAQATPPATEEEIALAEASPVVDRDVASGYPAYAMVLLDRLLIGCNDACWSSDPAVISGNAAHKEEFREMYEESIQLFQFHAVELPYLEHFFRLIGADGNRVIVFSDGVLDAKILTFRDRELSLRDLANLRGSSFGCPAGTNNSLEQAVSTFATYMGSPDLRDYALSAYSHARVSTVSHDVTRAVEAKVSSRAPAEAQRNSLGNESNVLS